MENLLKVFRQASPGDMEQARRSWATYNLLTRSMSNDFGFHPDVGAAVFAALSPNNDYHGNLRDARRLLAAARAGQKVEEVKVSTYHSNKRKAWAIAHGADPLSLIIYPKTRSFFLNIRDPNDPMPVTVDGHIYNAWRGQRVSLQSAATKFKVSLYETIAEDVRIIGREHGLVPNIVQGVLWFTWRRIHNIKFTLQTELWNAEARHAGYEVPWFEPLLSGQDGRPRTDNLRAPNATLY